MGVSRAARGLTNMRVCLLSLRLRVRAHTCTHTLVMGQVVGELVVDVPKLERMYPITDRPLLIKCGVVLRFVNLRTH